MLKKVLPYALATLGVLALLILVPTSPSLLVDSPEALWSSAVDAWGDPAGLMITKYALCIAAGGALALALTAFLGRQIGLRPHESVVLGTVCGTLALLCAHWLYCMLRWSYIVNDLGGSWLFLVQFWQGGYTMYGAIFGAMLGAVCFAKAMKRPVMTVMDLIVPGMMVVVCLGRLGEQFTLQGMGSYVANNALPMLPFVQADEWGTVQLRVYCYEALAALIALAATLFVGQRKAPAGRAAETGLAIVSLCQVILDSWRGDELIKFGFVRLNMILAAVVLAVIIGTRIARVARKDGFGPWCIARTAIFLFGALVVIGIEFALDKSTINNTLLYGVMAATLAVMGAAVLCGDGRSMTERRGIQQ